MTANEISSRIAWKYKNSLHAQRAWWLDVLFVVACSSVLGVLTGILLARIVG